MSHTYYSSSKYDDDPIPLLGADKPEAAPRGVIHNGLEERALEILSQLGLPVEPVSIHLDCMGRCRAVYPVFAKPALSTAAQRIGSAGAVCTGYGHRVITNEIELRFIVQ